jgi:PAS domain-containing protein
MAVDGPAGRPFLQGGGEAGALLRARDWRGSPLGLPEAWPQPLRCMLETCLNSPLLGAVLWGPELIMLYNDAYIPSLGDRHPSAFGKPVGEVWGEAWEQVSRPFLQAMQTGEGFERRAVRLDIMRHGKLEITWWDFSAAPIRDAEGRIVGLLNQGLETTEQVKALDAARAAEERYALVLSAGGGIGAWDWDVLHDTVVADERFARMYEVDPERAAQGAPMAIFFAAYTRRTCRA